MPAMKSAALLPIVALTIADCASTVPPIASTNTSAPTGPGPNWEEIDKTVQRVRAREENKPKLVETVRTSETVFPTMTDDEYVVELEKARDEVKKANPEMETKEVEAEATKRADAAKHSYEHTISRSASSTYELKRP